MAEMNILLEGSIQFETVKKHLSNMLDEWEAQYETGTQFSDESKEEYIAAARFMKAHGRKYSGLITEVELSMKSTF